MKKIIFPLLFLIATSSFAQFGVNAGVEGPSIQTKNFTYIDASFFGGVFYHLQLTERLALRPEVQYIYAAGDIEIDNINLNNIDELLVSNQIEYSSVLIYQFSDRWYAMGGFSATDFIGTDYEYTIGAKVGIGFYLTEKMSLELSGIITTQGYDDSDFADDYIIKDSFKVSYQIYF